MGLKSTRAVALVAATVVVAVVMGRARPSRRNATRASTSRGPRATGASIPD